MIADLVRFSDVKVGDKVIINNRIFEKVNESEVEDEFERIEVTDQYLEMVELL